MLSANNANFFHRMEPLDHPDSNGTQHRHSDGLQNATTHRTLSDDRKSIISDQPLFYEDESSPGAVMAYLNELRKQYQFADVHLSIQNHVIPAHRAVLACCSPYLFEFYKGQESDSIPLLHQLENVSPAAVEMLVSFCYTGRLDVPYCQVQAVYQAAKLWEMARVKNACAQHLVQLLNPKNCLELRSFASSQEDVEFVSIVDSFIKKNIDNLAVTNKFQELPRLQIEVVATKTSSKMSDRQLFETALDWVRRTVKCGKKLESLQQEPQTLLLSENNTLKDVEEYGEIEPDLIKDYKLDVKKGTFISPVKVTKGLSNRVSSTNDKERSKRLIVTPEDLSKAKSQIDKWKIVASTEMTVNSYIAIAILDRELYVIMLYEKVSQPKIPSPTQKRSFSIEREGAHPSLATLNQARCAVGVAPLDGCLIAAGGYNRDECHQSVEVYNPVTNTVDNTIAPMKTPRARFEFGVIDGKLYAAGGSDGHIDLRTCEVYDPKTNQWEWVADMPQERPSSGVTVLDGKLYVIGGSSGNTSLRTCDVYDPKTNQWTRISKMNHGRTQVGACALSGMIFAVGGSYNWNCHSSVEVYNPRTDQWSFITAMNTSRRGAAVCCYNDKMFALGGSDGQSALNSMESYDLVTKEWTSMASMLTARVNAGATVINGRIYAVGGFNGKHFLDTIESYDIADNQWSTFALHIVLERSQESPVPICFLERETEEKGNAELLTEVT